MSAKHLPKKGVELSINFIVMIIISLVVFGMGMMFIKKILAGAENTQSAYYQRYENEIQDIVCSTSEIVCIPQETRDYSKGDYPSYAVIITNTLNTASENTFKLAVLFNSAYKTDNSPLCGDPPNEDTCGNPSKWFTNGYDKGDIIIKNNAEVKKAIALAVKGAMSGTYVFDVTITADGNTYGNLHKIYLYVP